MKDYHFFASSSKGWSTNESLWRCLKKQQYNDRHGTFRVDGCTVWKIPLPADAKYPVNNYCPVVEGAVHVDTFKYLDR